VNKVRGVPQTPQFFKTKKPKKNKMALSKLSIEPYFEAEMPNMGLEKYGMVSFPDTEVREYLSIDVNGRFVTGVDPDAVAIESIDDEQEREIKRAEIVKIKERLERVFGKGSLDALNEKFWATFELTIKNSRRDLDLRQPKDEIVYHAIKAGGFDIVAPDFNTAKTSNKLYKFYLKKEEEESENKIKYTKVINKAKGILAEMYDSDPSLMFRIAKVALAAANNFKPTTAPGIIFEKLNDFIDGKVVKTNKRETATQFLAFAKQDRETLTITGIVHDAIYYNMLIQEKDGHYYNKETEARYGKNIKEIVEFLKNPINSTELENITDRIEHKWRN
jgi:hypothetical protein